MSETEDVAGQQAVEVRPLELATPDDLRAVDLNSITAETVVVDVFELHDLFHRRTLEAADGVDPQAYRVFRLLEGICSYQFKVEDRAEPFGPLLMMGATRSMVPGDCRGAQSQALNEVLNEVTHPGLRARLADTVWSNHRKQGHAAQVAIEAYADCVEGTLAGRFKHRYEGKGEVAYETLKLLTRAFQIAASANKKGEIPERLVRCLENIIAISAHVSEVTTFRRAAELGLRYGVLDPASVAGTAEMVIANASADTDPHFLQSVYTVAAEAYDLSKDETASRECRLKAAEQFVRLADLRKASAMVASSFLMDAIQALRRIKGTKERRKELEVQLRELQRDSLDEMGSFGTPIDLTELATGIIKVFDPLTLPEMLGQLAGMCGSPKVEDLRQQALDGAKEGPLGAMFSSVQLDDDGKVISRNPGLSTHEEPSDEWFKHRIAEAERMRREIVIRGQFEPVRQFISRRHGLSERHFMPIAEASPFVPLGYEHIFALGFARLLQGDYISAAHILLPQLENSLRYVLTQHAVDPSMIQSDMVQEDRALSVLLVEKREVLERIFGAALIFEIDMLFNDRAGPALRHDLAHGKLSAGQCYHASAIYGCWLIYRITCFPLFEDWAEVVGERLEEESF